MAWHGMADSPVIKGRKAMNNENENVRDEALLIARMAHRDPIREGADDEEAQAVF